ncbi:hypothetical protein [Alkalilimnicola sp. S0819]|uniref:hypothetical protein n=1 Tax=Alkalilimnicola sp. S0819 TaxID=2613922 RepID=UPI0012623D5D|nr:hypothetical protein [Alkalilimnicola sp. S0819]KAB7623990.1 hypothetical protein F3N43_08085 [Alkalilimnicola sp. S0819]MPQ16594.1 hypothetical protein [Alkalilimnicola sp. S0819]
MLKHSYRSLAAALLLAFAGAAHSDDVRHDDLIIEGSGCVGVDCVDNEDFSAAFFKLKENNLRLRFTDTNTIQPQEDGTWSVEFNSSTSGGNDYASFRMRDGVTEQLSDGTAPDFAFLGCPAHPGGRIPAGEPVVNPDCEVQYVTFEAPVITLGTAGDRSVILGMDSAGVPGEVSVGSPAKPHRLANVALALAATDAVIKAQLDAGVLGDYAAQVDALNRQLDTLSAELDALEAGIRAEERRNSGGGGSLSPLTLAALLLTWLVWRRRLTP